MAIERAIVNKPDEVWWCEILGKHNISWDTFSAIELASRVSTHGTAVCFRNIEDAQAFHTKHRGLLNAQRPCYVLAIPDERDRDEVGDIALITDDGTYSIRNIRSLLT